MSKGTSGLSLRKCDDHTSFSAKIASKVNVITRDGSCSKSPLIEKSYSYMRLHRRASGSVQSPSHTRNLREHNNSSQTTSATRQLKADTIVFAERMSEKVIMDPIPAESITRKVIPDLPLALRSDEVPTKEADLLFFSSNSGSSSASISKAKASSTVRNDSPVSIVCKVVPEDSLLLWNRTERRSTGSISSSRSTRAYRKSNLSPPIDVKLGLLGPDLDNEKFLEKVRG